MVLTLFTDLNHQDYLNLYNNIKNMAHFAQIDNDNKVTQVLVVDNSQEHRGEAFLAGDLRLGGRWIQTSYNHNFRKQFAGVGFTYDEEGDVFVTPQPYPSWTLDANFDWQPPVEVPEDGLWNWDESTLNWIAL
jgi:hypothetical protein